MCFSGFFVFYELLFVQGIYESSVRHAWQLGPSGIFNQAGDGALALSPGSGLEKNNG